MAPAVTQLATAVGPGSEALVQPGLLAAPPWFMSKGYFARRESAGAVVRFLDALLER